MTAQNFANYFKAINDPGDRFVQLDEDILFCNQRYLDGEICIMFDELNGEITMLEIRKAVQSLKMVKAVDFTTINTV